MATRITSNTDELIRYYERAQRREHTLRIINTAEYAAYLQAKLGIWVFNDAAAMNIVRNELEKALDAANARGDVIRDRDVTAALDRAADRIADYYQQVMGTKDTPGRHRPPPRPRHRGQWADDAGLLADSFYTQVDDRADRHHPYNQ